MTVPALRTRCDALTKRGTRCTKAPHATVWVMYNGHTVDPHRSCRIHVDNHRRRGWW